MVFFGLTTLHALNAPCVGSNNSCTENWSAPVAVFSVGSDFGSSGGFLFNFVKLADNTCEIRTSGSPQLMVPASHPYAAQKLQGMKSVVMSAASSGANIRVHWTNNYCWIDDVVLCGEGSCITSY